VSSGKRLKGMVHSDRNGGHRDPGSGARGEQISEKERKVFGMKKNGGRVASLEKSGRS